MKTVLLNFAAVVVGFSLFAGRVPTEAPAFGIVDKNGTTTSHLDEPVDFKNDLIPMFTKLGCNAGKCHGSAIGRGDFKLSLYGEPQKPTMTRLFDVLAEGGLTWWTPRQVFFF